jgi:hypothetical protein
VSTEPQEQAPSPDPDPQSITALEVLGMGYVMTEVRRGRQAIPPCILVQGENPRAKLRVLGETVLQNYRDFEAKMVKERQAGNPAAWFMPTP